LKRRNAASHSSRVFILAAKREKSEKTKEMKKKTFFFYFLFGGTASVNRATVGLAIARNPRILLSHGKPLPLQPTISPHWRFIDS
jgi:hypothetical protein